MLGSAATIKKGIYVPGNHDHTLWTNYHRLRHGKDNSYGITGPTGDLLVQQGKRCDENDSATELLTIFFGYPAGSAWRKIQEERGFDFAIANPLYVTQINERTYVFTHGTHFRKDVTLPKWIKRVFDYLQLDKLLGNIELESDCDVTEADSLESFEQIVAPFVDACGPVQRTTPPPGPTNSGICSPHSAANSARNDLSLQEARCSLGSWNCHRLLSLESGS